MMSLLDVGNAVGLNHLWLVRYLFLHAAIAAARQKAIG